MPRAESPENGAKKKAPGKGAGRGFDWRKPLPGRGLFTPRCGANGFYPVAAGPNRIRKRNFPLVPGGYISSMFQSVDRERVRQLADEGAQLVEVLEPRQYRLAHLPGALNIPAWELTRARADKELDRDRPVVVYCFDTL